MSTAPARPAAPAAEGPEDLSHRSWRQALKRTFKQFQSDDLTTWAAALTYYSVLSLFPALLALVTVLGVIGPSATDPIIDQLTQAAPGSARDIVIDAVRNLEQDQGAAGLLLVISLVVAIWSASGYVAGFMKASNAIYGVEEGRSFVRQLPARIGTTVALLLMLVLVSLAVTFTGPLAEEIGDMVGVGDTGVMVWDIAKWPFVLMMLITMLALLYWAAPNVHHPPPGFRWITPGGVVGVAAVILASLIFALYVANFGSYNETYGAIGGVIVFLTWLWIANVAVLFGAELNAELEHSRQIEAGLPADQEPFLPPRSTEKMSPEGQEQAAAVQRLEDDETPASRSQ